jgi:hypothetical protein
MEEMKMPALKTEVTPKMQREIRKHYKAQGVTDVDLKASDVAALVPMTKAKVGTSWRLWHTANGVTATCSDCSHGFAVQDCDTWAKFRAIRFKHCGRSERLPLLLLLTFLFVNKYSPLAKPQAKTTAPFAVIE